MEFQLKSEQLNLQYDVPANLKIKVDPQALRQMLVNLLSNAIKFSRSGSVIIVRARVRPETCEICVIDQGCGIPAAQLDSVMKPFQQARSDYVASAQPGTGLGLAFVDNRMRLHRWAGQNTSECHEGPVIWPVSTASVLMQESGGGESVVGGER